jgi:hypothetical protein
MNLLESRIDRQETLTTGTSGARYGASSTCNEPGDNYREGSPLECQSPPVSCWYWKTTHLPMSTVEEQARLRAAMDKDMSDLKAGLGAQMKLIQAISDTQSDHTRQIGELREGVDELRAGQHELRAGQRELRAGYQEVIVGVKLINTKLDQLIADDK